MGEYAEDDILSAMDDDWDDAPSVDLSPIIRARDPVTDLEEIWERHVPENPGPCRECGGAMEIVHISGDRATYACHAETGQQSRGHYRDSRVTVKRGDPAVLALCDEVEVLRQTVRGCETCGGDGVMMVPAGYNEDGVGDLRPEVCAECHGTCVSSWGQAIDEAAALRAEVEALRAQVAAAPEVLREWPTVESAMLLKLEGPWCYVTRSAAIGDAMHVGCWTPGGRGPVFIVSREKAIQRDAFRPGEFFVRVP